MVCLIALMELMSQKRTVVSYLSSFICEMSSLNFIKQVIPHATESSSATTDDASRRKFVATGTLTQTALPRTSCRAAVSS